MSIARDMLLTAEETLRHYTARVAELQAIVEQHRLTQTDLVAVLRTVEKELREHPANALHEVLARRCASVLAKVQS